MPFAIDRAFIDETLVRLVQINSVNPLLDPAAPGEAEIAQYLSEQLTGLGLAVERFEPTPGRVSVVGRLAGTGGGRSLMLNAHVDTVGVDGMDEPFSARMAAGRLYGRGAYDMKGALAACVGAVKALRDEGTRLAGDVVVAAVADEEYSSLGTSAVIDGITVDGAIVTEPTALRVCLAHKGYAWHRVTTHGRAAHGSRFDEGVDANLRMGRVLSALDALERELRQSPPHALVGPPSLHAGLLRGGTGISTYAGSCELDIERRTIPGEMSDEVEREITALLDRLRSSDPAFTATHEMYFWRDPFEVSPDAAIVQSVERAATRVLGQPPPRMGDTPWMDSALLAAAGVDTVVIGPTGAGAHAAEEWVDLASVHQLASVLAHAAADYCGRTS